MTRYAIGIEYSGSEYHGWQRQPNVLSVQQTLEEALGFVANHPIELNSAGRTDAGVHAIEQVAHFDAAADRTERAWVLGTNCRLPRDIRLRWACAVTDDFHARFSATARTYRYAILNAEVPSAVFYNRCSWEFKSLDAASMHEAAQVLIGEHDFSSFRAAGCQAKTALRDIRSIEVHRNGEFVYLDVEANAFLYHMVRNITGSLVKVGHGEQNFAWFKRVFESCDRKLAGATASAAGLYLISARYPSGFKLPAVARKPVLF